MDVTDGTVMQGHASGLDDAKTNIRAAFEGWQAWALAMPSTDLKRPRISREWNELAY